MSKGRNRSVPKTVNLKDARFAYVSVCCQSIAEKPACSVPQNAKIGTYPKIGIYLGAIPPDDRQVGLGSWCCSVCKKSCKVTRTKQDASQNSGSKSRVSETVSS